MNHFRAKHLFLVSDSLVFQFVCTSPEALLNLEIIFVIIIYSLYYHNTSDGQPPSLLGTVQEKHKTSPPPSTPYPLRSLLNNPIPSVV